MRKIFQFAVCLVLLSGLALGSQSFMIPAPAPGTTTYKFTPNQWLDTSVNPNVYRNYYDIKYSVYDIVHDGYGFFNEGPFYPGTSNNTHYYENSEWGCTYTTGTYATVWVKETSADSWTSYGSMSMATWNTTKFSGTNTVNVFNIDMDLFESPY